MSAAERPRRLWRVLAVVGLTMAPSVSWTLGLPPPGHPLLVTPPVAPAVADIQDVAAPAQRPVRVTVPGDGQRAPASVSPLSPSPGSTNATGVPGVALIAYQRSAETIDAAMGSCHLDWTLLAAIGQVESDHGRANGSHLDVDGVARPPIIGLRLDGRRGTSRVRDSDAGHLDGDPSFDRAVGPMQFLPSTWSTVAVDGDQDGLRRAQDIDDAALASAVYLCAGGDDLATLAGERTAVLRYNHSTAYVDTVLDVARTIRLSAVGLLFDDVPPAGGTPPTLGDTIAHEPDPPSASAEVLPHAIAVVDPPPLPAPTDRPSVEPTPPPTSPTAEPTSDPTAEPTAEPTDASPSTPAEVPFPEPTSDASVTPTDEPTTETTPDVTTESAPVTPSNSPLDPASVPPELADFTLDQVTAYDEAWAVCALPTGHDSVQEGKAGRALRQCLADMLTIDRHDAQLLAFLAWAARCEDAPEA